MKNKFKVAAVLVAVVVGMVLYKEQFDRKEKVKKDADDKKASAKADRNNWN